MANHYGLSGDAPAIGRAWTTKMRRFVYAYAGDGYAAALAAGYKEKSARQRAYELLRDPRVVAAIEEREAKTLRPLIANRVKRQEWLARRIEDPALDMELRVKAMALLQRSCGDFLDRVEVTGGHTVALPDVDAETVRTWARRTLPKPQPQEEEAEIVGPH